MAVTYSPVWIVKKQSPGTRLRKRSGKGVKAVLVLRVPLQ